MRPRGFRHFHLLCLLCLLAQLDQDVNAAKTDDVCLSELRRGLYGPGLGLDLNGKPVLNLTEATAVSLKTCREFCDTNYLESQWMDSLTQFGTWELPWLALVSQLPFDTNASNLENAQSMLLMVGSPALTAYTQTLTILNNRWVVDRFAQSTLPHTQYLVRVLADMQNVPFNINTDVRLLASSLALPSNHEFWKMLVSWMEYTHSDMWTTYTKFSLVWVIVAYAITVADSFEDSYWPTLSSGGQSIGALWFWLLPVILIWMRLSPRTNVKRLHSAISLAHTRSQIANSDGQIQPAENLDPLFEVAYKKQKFTWHTESASPIHNHSRVYAWSQLVEFFAQADSVLSRQMLLAEQNVKNAAAGASQFSLSISIPAGVVQEFEEFVQKGWDVKVSRWSPGQLKRTGVAALSALFLQLGTTGPAFFMNYLTYTRGLGCKSLSALVYGFLATLSGLLVVSSSAIAHRHATAEVRPEYPSILASLFRVTGKGLAYINAVLLVTGNILQIGRVTSNCFCSSSWFSLGKRAFVVWYAPRVLPLWIGGVGGVIVAAILYLFFLTLLWPKKLLKNA